MVETNFRIGDRVEFTHPKTGQVVSGTVQKHLRNGRISVSGDNGIRIKWQAENFRPTKVPAPAREHNPFTAGDRVMFTDKHDKSCFGTVKSVRDERITMNVDGGMYRVRGHFKTFQKA